MSTLDIRSEQSESRYTLYLKGDLNMQTSPKLMQALEPLFSSSATSITIHMSHLLKVDSTGVATLVEGLRWSQHTKHSFMLQSVSQAVMALLKMYKLQNAFEVTHG